MNTRRDFIKSTLATALTTALPAVSLVGPRTASAAAPVKLGILHSLTGTIAIAEAHVVDAEKMAIDEINAGGGVLGRPLVAVVEDGASDWPTFAEKAQKLLQSDKVVATFGCYTSASRKAVLPVFERYNGLLYYPTYYEGLEMSKNILYTGQEATQSVIPAVNWLAQNKGKKFYLIGSDYIWPRTTNRIARPTIAKAGGMVVGEDYLPLGNVEFSSLINKIRAAKPDVILSTIVGGSNVALFKQLNAAGINGRNTTVLALAVTEDDAIGIGREALVGVHSCMGYFQSVANARNQKFVAAFKAKYGPDRVVGDTMAAAYTAVHMWKLAAEKAGSVEPQKVIAASAGLSWDAPEGGVRFHPTNHHLLKHARIGVFRPDGQVQVLYESPLIEPNPFPKL
ncbi:urea ABC transporter substrate-binding protein [Cupriavidus necator]|uniref:urea ABC transporter substrate-binding protein n=1 Tax=Cupriavidus necator TaxID=106590 RepID=UPI0039C1B230